MKRHVYFVTVSAPFNLSLEVEGDTESDAEDAVLRMNRKELLARIAREGYYDEEADDLTVQVNCPLTPDV